MYEHSRRLFTALRPMVVPGRPVRPLLDASERMVRRIAADLAGPSPARALFSDVRWLFRPTDQLPAYTVIESLVSEIEAAFEVDRRCGRSALRCAALNRRGEPCGREPILGERYCPSHAHMARPRVATAA